MKRAACFQNQKTKTPSHGMFKIPVITDIINSYQGPNRGVEAQHVTSKISGILTPYVEYLGRGELKEGLKVLYVGERVRISTLRLPRSLKEIRYRSHIAIDRPRDIYELEQMDRTEYILFMLRYDEKSESKKSLEDEFKDRYGWPLSLKKISFSDNYHLSNEITEKTLPRSLTYLKMGDNFEQKITSGMLPPFLKKLQLSYNFNRDILEGDLPGSLTHLRLGDFSKQKGVLPVVRLAINRRLCRHTIKSLKSLVAPKLTHLLLGETRYVEKAIYRLNKIALPASLIHIVFQNSSGCLFDSKVHLNKVDGQWVRIQSTCKINVYKEGLCRKDCFAWDSDCEFAISPFDHVSEPIDHVSE